MNKIDPDNPHRDWQLVATIAQASLKEQRRARRWGLFFKLFTCVYVTILLAGVFWRSGVDGNLATENHVAVIYLEGTIAADQPANANDIIPALRNAFSNTHAQAVILFIDSPGGSPVQSGYIYDEITRLRALHPNKKLYSVIGDVGASGGYYIAAAADEIYADKSSLVGSIGVIASGFGFVNLMEKVGIERRTYSSGKHKNFLDPFAPQQQDDTAFWQSVLDSTHQQFIDAVKKGRGDRLADDENLYSGLVWNGEQALEKGLIDGLGSVGHVARDVIQQEKIYDYTTYPTPFEEFSKKLGVAIGQGLGAVLNTTLNSPVQLQ